MDPSATRSGRPPKLSTMQVDQLVAFRQSSPEARRMSSLELSFGLLECWNCGEEAYRGALKCRGYRRYRAVAKPILSDENMAKRLKFAEENVDWTLEQWSQVLWSDETRVRGESHKPMWVIRKVDETTRIKDNCPAQLLEMT